MLVKNMFEPLPRKGTIWESANKNFHDYKIFNAAWCTVHHRLNLQPNNMKRSLSGSYQNCTAKRNGDYFKTLMELEGNIFIDNDGFLKSYACSGADGITFNYQLFNIASAIGIRPDNRGNVVDWTKTFDGVAVFIILQQVIEHELGHIMNHQHGLFENGKNDPLFQFITPKKAPLYGESGFHVQEMAQRRASTKDPTKRGFIAGLLEIENLKNFCPPLLNKVYFSHVKNSEVKRPDVDKIKYPQSVKELEDYIDSYPRFTGPFDARRSLRTKRQRSISANTTPPPKQPNSRNRNSPIVGLFDTIKQMSQKSKHVEPQNETGTDWTDRHDGFPDILDTEYESESDIFGSWKVCDITATFCDERRAPRNEFVVGEAVYVMIEFQNNSDETVYVTMHNKTFGRNGIALRIDGLVERYTNSSMDFVHVALAKGESYKFFRILCPGDNDSFKTRYPLYRYHATKEPGIYSNISLRSSLVEHLLPSCTLRIAARGEVPELVE